MQFSKSLYNARKLLVLLFVLAGLQMQALAQYKINTLTSGQGKIQYQ